MRVGKALDAAHSFPFRPLREMLEDRPFIVIAPHPDDESLACGGLIAAACGQGLRAKVVIVSDGAGSHPNSKAYPPDRLSALREDEAKQAGAELGLRPEDMLFLRLPDRFVPHEGEEAGRAIEAIVDCAREIGAGSLFVSWRHDPIATMRRPTGSPVRSSVAQAKSDCSNMSSGGIRFRPRLRLIRCIAASGSA
jgi:GlcNAc-PI de-N-acetylase